MAIAQMNSIDEMTLDLICNNQEQASRIESELYDFARNDLAEAIDEALTAAAPEDEDVVIENITIDLGSVPPHNPLNHIRQALPQTLTNQVKKQLFEKKHIPVVKILQESCSRHLPFEKASAIENEIRKCIADWCDKHYNEKFDALQAAETALKQLQALNPELDIKQIACNTFEKLKNLDKKTDTPQTRLPRAGDCGVVLLAPYIPMLFEKTGCTHGGQFGSDEQRTLAVSVLSYTTYGRYTPPPADVSIIQLLCGIEADKVLTEMPLLSDNQKDIAESLLNGVITNWSAIGRTSADGLRSSFLIRAGTLGSEDSGLQLKIPPTAYDLLLDKLPWSYSTVKLPWMKNPLHVTWR